MVYKELNMRTRFVRTLQLIAAGAIAFQAAGCTFQQVNELLQTAFLGVTAAGSYVILRNL